MPYTFFESTIQNIENLTPQVKRFILSKPNLPEYVFQAGQFIMLDLPIDSRIKTRSYSIVSAPHEPFLELVIVLNPAGKGTPYLFSEVKTGDQLSISKPIGKFTLTDLSKPLFFISTGTGIAPYISFLRHLDHHGFPFVPIHLIAGYRYDSDILYHQEILGFSKKYPNFKYIPVLSRKNPGWNGREGYVHDVYKPLINAGIACNYYLCGWSAMIHDARDILLKNEIPGSCIHFELYD